MGEARILRVRLTARARDQIDAALVYVATDSPSGAARLRARLLLFLKSLESHPLLGRAVDRRDVRRLNISPYPYFIIYRVRGDDVVVQRFRHAARRP